MRIFGRDAISRKRWKREKRPTLSPRYRTYVSRIFVGGEKKRRNQNCKHSRYSQHRDKHELVTCQRGIDCEFSPWFRQREGWILFATVPRTRGQLSANAEWRNVRSPAIKIRPPGAPSMASENEKAPLTRTRNGERSPSGDSKRRTQNSPW